MSDMENPTPAEEQTQEDPFGGQEPAGEEKTFVEELTVAGNQLVKEVQRLVDEGNVRRLIIKQGDKVLLDVSLTLGVVGAGTVALLAPWSAAILAAIGALAAVVAQVTIIIERVEEEGGEEGEESE